MSKKSVVGLVSIFIRYSYLRWWNFLVEGRRGESSAFLGCCIWQPASGEAMNIWLSCPMKAGVQGNLGTYVSVNSSICSLTFPSTKRNTILIFFKILSV